MQSNQFYKNKALASLEGKWSNGIIATLIYLVLGMGVSWTITAPMGNNLTMSYSTSGLWTLICLPLGWGFVVYFLRLIRDEDLGYGHLFDGYKDFVRIFLAELLSSILITLGCIALIIPGIIEEMTIVQILIADETEEIYDETPTQRQTEECPNSLGAVTHRQIIAHGGCDGPVDTHTDD